jgi:hypothetical protein
MCTVDHIQSLFVLSRKSLLIDFLRSAERFLFVDRSLISAKREAALLASKFAQLHFCYTVAYSHYLDCLLALLDRLEAGAGVLYLASFDCNSYWIYYPDLFIKHYLSVATPFFELPASDSLCFDSESVLEYFEYLPFNNV